MDRADGARVHSTIALILALVAFALGLLPWVSAFNRWWVTADSAWTMSYVATGVGNLSLGGTAEARQRIRKRRTDQTANRTVTYFRLLPVTGIASVFGMMIASQGL